MLNVVMLSVVTLNVVMLNVIMLSVVMLNVNMLSVVMLSVIMLSVVILSVIMPSDIMLSVITLSVVTLSAVAPSPSLSNFHVDHQSAFLVFTFSFHLKTLCQTQSQKIDKFMMQRKHLFLKIRGCIFSCVRPFYEQAVSNLDP
jgi:hypothetical protein